MLSKGGVEGPAGTANAVPLFLTVRRYCTTILVDRRVECIINTNLIYSASKR